ncbi:hypothetical protein [Nocardia sp. NBC_01329]|uniref:hypothetical protein n=1 Tax=Nocardia sp. NBC_01329 TaxID=2903594 RepID=UPI002E141EF7|nr:hypothetical protein OG405_24130 [Nocardia sp. NBC_01329]
MNDTALVYRDNTIAARPAAVTTAFVALMAAVGWGVAETVVHSVGLLTDNAADIGSLAGNWLFRSVVYGVVLAVAWRMSRGDRWARVLLTAGIGVIGTASLVVEPIRMFAASGTDVFTDLSATTVLVALTRIGHLCAVFVAIPAMYTPAARSWFRAGPGAERYEAA